MVPRQLLSALRDAMPEIKTGIVKFYNVGKGYGFIQFTDNEGDIFFHISDFDPASDDPVKGQRVSFCPGKSRDGKPRATNVRAAPD